MSSSALLTESERSSLYSLSIDSAAGLAVANGTVLYPGTQIIATVGKKSGAGEPAALDFSFAAVSSAANASSAASLRFVTSASKAVTGSSLAIKRVASIEGELEGFSIPKTAASGAYALTVSISGSDGSSLQQEKMYVFVGSAQPAIDSVSVFPPSVEPGASVLLGLTASWRSLLAPSSFSASEAAAIAATDKVRDPWIRWSKDGSSFAEGLLSAGLGKVVWTAPSAEGAYSITAEVFPTAPSSGSAYAFKAAASQELKVMVIAASSGTGNDFSNPLSFYSLLKLDGSFEDSGTRPRGSQPLAFGSPALDTYASGFGYRFGSSSGVKIPALMPPSSGGKLGAFAVLFRLDASQADGSLIRFASSDEAYVLSLGLKGGKPYVETKVGGLTRQSVAAASLPQSPLTLEAVLTPDGDKLDIAWRAEGELIEAPSLDLPSAPPAGSATIGGAGSLPGVYDGFGLMVPGSSGAYPSPTYRLASRRKWKSSLILAESFEDGVAPASSSSAGKVAFSASGLSLEPSSSLTLAPSFGIGSGLVAEAEFSGDRPSSLLAFSLPGGDRAFAVRATGEVLDASGVSLGSVSAKGAKLSLSIEQRDDTVFIVGSGGQTVSFACSAKQLSLSISREAGGAGSAVVGKVILRSASAKP
jgi:hypothetical protein